MIIDATRLRARSLLAICVAALFAFACSGSSDPDPTATPVATATRVPEPTPTAEPAEPAPIPLTWEDCGDGFECADIAVPLDYEDTAKGTVTLPLIRRPAGDSATRIGSLLVNPGGPGVSGVDFVRRASTLFSRDVRDHFDIVGWDPRGVAGSQPSVDCVDSLDDYISGDPSPDSVEEQHALDEAARAFAEGCAARSGGLLPYLATSYTARDMDLLRASLGDEKLTYFGYSYGSFLGAIYAELFPSRIRAMVLDAAADPSISPQQDIKNQVLGFEASLNAFFAYCAADSSCAFHSDGDPATAYDNLMRSIEENPVYGDALLDVGVGIAEIGVISALYNERNWPTLGEALAEARDGDGSRLLSLSAFVTGRQADGSYSNEVEQRIATICVDSPRLSYDEKVALQAELKVLAPRFGQPGVGPAGDACDFWPAEPFREPVAVTAPGSPPILVVGTTGDPATPYQQAVSLADQLSRGVLLTLNAERHTAYGGVSACIDEAVDAYLIDLVPPPDGTTCG
jgi:pimeloyl-ACP methyl ester carboxylesterase